MVCGSSPGATEQTPVGIACAQHSLLCCCSAQANAHYVMSADDSMCFMGANFAPTTNTGLCVGVYKQLLVPS